jgi:hypothetical protein
MIYILSCVVHKFFLLAGSVVHQHLYFALLRPDDHALAAHAAYHIERIHRPAPESQFQHVLLDAALQGLFQVMGDLEESVGRAQAPDALVRALVVVVLDPESGALHGLLEAVELGPLEELAQDRFPKAFDLAQGHGVVGTGTDVLDAVFFHLPFEMRLSAPVRVLSAVVGEHLSGNAVLGNTPAVGLQHVLGRLAAVQSQGNDIPAVVVHEADQVGVAAGQAEGHDVALPQLVWTRAFEEPGLGGILLRFALGLVDQPLLRQRFVYGRGAGSNQEKSFEHIGNPSRAIFRIRCFHRYHSLPDFGRHPGISSRARLGFQPLQPTPSVSVHPAANRMRADTELFGKQRRAVLFFQEQPYDL